MKKAFVALILVAVLAIIASPMLARSPQHPRHVADLSFVGVTDRSEVVLARDTVLMPAIQTSETAAPWSLTIAPSAISASRGTYSNASMRTIGSRPRDQNRYSLRC